MARRSHFSFNKRQKEIRQKEKQQKKIARRLAKREPEATGTATDTAPEAELVDTEQAEGPAEDENVESPDHDTVP